MTIGRIYRRLRDWGLVPIFFQKIAQKLRNIYQIVIRVENISREINELQNTVGNYRDELDAVEAVMLKLNSKSSLSKDDVNSISEWLYIIESAKKKL